MIIKSFTRGVVGNLVLGLAFGIGLGVGLKVTVFLEEKL